MFGFRFRKTHCRGAKIPKPYCGWGKSGFRRCSWIPQANKIQLYLVQPPSGATLEGLSSGSASSRQGSTNEEVQGSLLVLWNGPGDKENPTDFFGALNIYDYFNSFIYILLTSSTNSPWPKLFLVSYSKNGLFETGITAKATNFTSKFKGVVPFIIKTSLLLWLCLRLKISRKHAFSLKP